MNINTWRSGSWNLCFYFAFGHLHIDIDLCNPHLPVFNNVDAWKLTLVHLISATIWSLRRSSLAIILSMANSSCRTFPSVACCSASSLSLSSATLSCADCIFWNAAADAVGGGIDSGSSVVAVSGTRTGGGSSLGKVRMDRAELIRDLDPPIGRLDRCLGGD